MIDPVSAILFLIMISSAAALINELLGYWEMRNGMDNRVEALLRERRPFNAGDHVF